MRFCLAPGFAWRVDRSWVRLAVHAASADSAQRVFGRCSTRLRSVLCGRCSTRLQSVLNTSVVGAQRVCGQCLSAVGSQCVCCLCSAVSAQRPALNGRGGEWHVRSPRLSGCSPYNLRVLVVISLTCHTSHLSYVSLMFTWFHPWPVESMAYVASASCLEFLMKSPISTQLGRLGESVATVMEA